VSVLRRATPGDRDAVLAMVAEFYAVDRHPFDSERVDAALMPLLADDQHGQVWLIGVGDDGRAAGYAVVTWSWSLESGGRDCILDELYIRDRGRGLGTAALHEIMERSAAYGASAMFLETEAHNHRARAFYARNGFTADDSIWMSRAVAD
jgi:GNAT superfamily N-acetyltransferase